MEFSLVATPSTSMCCTEKLLTHDKKIYVNYLNSFLFIQLIHFSAYNNSAEIPIIDDPHTSYCITYSLAFVTDLKLLPYKTKSLESQEEARWSGVGTWACVMLIVNAPNDFVMAAEPMNPRIPSLRRVPNNIDHVSTFHSSPLPRRVKYATSSLVT